PAPASAGPPTPSPYNRLMRGIRHFLLVCLLGSLFGGCHSQPSAPAQLQPASTELIRRSIEYLASDQMEGRGPGTAGINAAANYIACYFKGLGLQPPPGQKSYFQPFHYITVNGVDPKTNLKTPDKSWKTDHDSLVAKAKLAADHGAVALLIVHPPTHHGPEILASISRRFGERPAPIPVIHIKQYVAEDLLKSAGAGDLKSHQTSIDDSFAP